MHQAVTESLLEEANDNHDEKDAPGNKGSDENEVYRKKRPRNQSSQKNERICNKEEPVSDDSDGLGDPDFGDGSSHDEAEGSSDTEERERLKKSTNQRGSKKRAAEKPSDTGNDITASQSIPKKSNIPRRQQQYEPASQSLLLASLKSAATPIDTTSTSKLTSSNMPASTVRKDSSSFPKHLAATTTAAPSPNRATGFSNKVEHPSSVAGIQVVSRLHPQQRADTSNGPSNVPIHVSIPSSSFPSESHQPQQLSRLEHQALNGFSELCRFIRERDVRFNGLGAVRSVDLGGTFLQNDSDRLDFFDTNARGEIILQPRPPIFPEDFPPHMKDHSLAWWGIMDPALGDGKFRPLIDSNVPLSASSSSPSQRTSSRSPPRPDNRTTGAASVYPSYPQSSQSVDVPRGSQGSHCDVYPPVQQQRRMNHANMADASSARGNPQNYTKRR
jgi:hypothetical protein